MLYIRIIYTKCELALRLASRTCSANRKIVNERFISALNLAWLRIPHELCIIYGIDSRGGRPLSFCAPRLRILYEYISTRDILKSWVSNLGRFQFPQFCGEMSEIAATWPCTARELSSARFVGPVRRGAARQLENSFSEPRRRDEESRSGLFQPGAWAIARSHVSDFVY